MTSDIITQKQRLHTAWEDFARTASGISSSCLKAQSDKLSAEIASMIDDDPLWQALATEFTAYKGLASRTVAVLMADLREIGTLSNRAISKLAGLAPLADDSGKRQGRRSIRGGRASVRNILFLIGGHLARFSPTLRPSNTGFRKKARPRCKYVSHWPPNSSSGSMQKHAIYVQNMYPQLDNKDSRSPPLRGREV
ncbi:MAG: transposase [Asticcacaulis sp.]